MSIYDRLRNVSTEPVRVHVAVVRLGRWNDVIAPLATEIAHRFRQYIIASPYPVRAGAHTNTAMSLASTLLDLIEHPDDLARVQEEIAALPRDAPLDLQTLRTLVHLHRSITETLRLRSNGGIWRMVMSDMTLGGHRLASGSVIGSRTRMGRSSIRQKAQ